GLPALLDLRPAERGTTRAVQIVNALGLLLSVLLAILLVVAGRESFTLVLGEWVLVPHFHFDIKFLFDALSLSMVILSFVLCGTIGAFSGAYMHREPGFQRFHVLYALFVLG